MRVLIITHIGETLGHLIRGLAIADELNSRGVTVEFAASEKAKRLFQRGPTEYKHHQLSWKWSHNSCDPSMPSVPFLQRVADSVGGILDLLRRSRPDFIISMPGFATTQAARRIGIPHVSVNHGPYVSPILRLKDPNPIESAVIEYTKNICNGPVNTIFSMLSRKFNLPRLDYETYLRTETIFVPQPGLDLPDLPNLHQTSFIRASLGPSLEPEPDHLNEACHITFGTGNSCDLTRVVELASKVFPLLVVSTGNLEINISRPNVIMRPFIASSSVAGRVATVISHGGTGTVGTFAEFGTPHLIIPTELDQANMAVHASRLGIAQFCGLRSLAERNMLGRRMPEFSDDEFIGALQSLRDQRQNFIGRASSGALEIADSLLNMFKSTSASQVQGRAG